MGEPGPETAAVGVPGRRLTASSVCFVLVTSL
jgi:hypothetical protein